jgi:hypothetical protein
MHSRIMRQVRGSQRARATGKLRVIFAVAVAVMGVINDLTVLLPTRPGRLELLGSLLNRLAPFAPSILPVLDTGRTLALPPAVAWTVEKRFTLPCCQ